MRYMPVACALVLALMVTKDKAHAADTVPAPGAKAASKAAGAKPETKDEANDAIDQPHFKTTVIG